MESIIERNGGDDYLVYQNASVHYERDWNRGKAKRYCRDEFFKFRSNSKQERPTALNDLRLAQKQEKGNFSILG